MAFPVLYRLIDSPASQELRLAAIESLAAFGDPMISPLLLSRIRTETPTIRRRVLQLMLRNAGRTKLILTEIERRDRFGPQSGFAISDLDSATVQSLLNHKDDPVRDQARRVLAAAIPADRKAVLEAYQPALSLKADAKRGRGVFEKNCANCHKIGDVGVNVAPDISDSRTKTPAQLLNDILNPNQAIDGNYVSYTVLTKDGMAQTGIVAAETASSITLRQPEGKTVLILRTEIDEMRSSGVSLMPEGLEKNVSVEQMADLISFIKNWRYLDGSVPLGIK